MRWLRLKMRKMICADPHEMASGIPKAPMREPQNGDLIAGAAIVDVVAKWNRWVHRRVDSVHPLVDERGRRRSSLDCSPPPDPALAYDPSERFFDAPDQVQGQIMVPLAYLNKGPLREFDARLSDGRAMPVLGAQDTLELGVAMVHSELTRTSDTVPDGLLRIIREIVGPRTSSVDLPLVDRFLSTGQWQGRWFDLGAFDGNDASELIRTLAGKFLLIGLVDSQAAGVRQVLKFSYDWHVEGVPAGKLWDSFKVAVGWSTREMVVPLEAPSATASYHLEFQTPPEARCRLLSIPGGGDGSFDDSRRPVMHAHASYTAPPETEGEAVIDLPFRGLRSIVLMAALFTLLVTVGALVLPGAERVWRSEPEGPATVLLVAPAILFALLATRGESALIREPMNVLRAGLFVSGISLFLVAASLVGELKDVWLQTLWIVVAVVNGALVVCLVVGWRISERRSDVATNGRASETSGMLKKSKGTVR